MNIDLGSFAFGSYLNSGVGTPSWGTALGQSSPYYKFTYPGSEVLLIGMVYCSVPLENVQLPLGRGGRVFQASEHRDCQLASLFRKVYINGAKINYPFIIVLTKEDSASHPGRRSIKYSDKITYESETEEFSNQEFIQEACVELGLEEDACWFVYSFEVYNQDELHMSAVIVDHNNSVEYENSSERRNEWLDLIPEDKEFVRSTSPRIIEAPNNLQIIYYGAPGTGKSFTIKEQTEGKDVIRTTFHPDSDYSTFVGAYKPTTKEVPVISNFGGKAIKVKDEDGKDIKEERIVYEFVNQAFLQAYVGAWQKLADNSIEPKKQFLVIEEINRGNCAQIFGDLFQLLDRNPQGFSEYPIKADADMKKQLKKQLAGLSIENAAAINALYKNEDVVSKVLDGDILLLPCNLFIWATMNTSDQSLFPIDSAFKRRWDWKYVPIANAEKNWAIEANGKKYDWWDFLKKINSLIGETTNSEDKKLGYFFCKTETGIIDAETFVGKVIFYLWNDVFKDFEFEGDVFVDTDGETKLTFDKFYNPDATVRESTVEVFLNNLGVELIEEGPAVMDDEEETEEQPEETLEDPVEREQSPSINTGRQRFFVTFPDGTTIEERTQFETYTKALQKIGLDKAEAVAAQKRYTRKNCALIDRIQREEILNSTGFTYVTIEGYHIVKNILVDTMRDVINNISQVMNLGVQAVITRV